MLSISPSWLLVDFVSPSTLKFSFLLWNGTFLKVNAIIPNRLTLDEMIPVMYHILDFFDADVNQIMRNFVGTIFYAYNLSVFWKFNYFLENLTSDTKSHGFVKYLYTVPWYTVVEHCRRNFPSIAGQTASTDSAEPCCERKQLMRGCHVVL